MAFDAKDVAAFLARKADRAAEARQRAALQLSCGIDIDSIPPPGDPRRGQVVARIERELRRMRQAGLRKHWSYDLNRHIALRQLHDRLTGRERALPAPPGRMRKRRRRDRLAAAAPS